MSYEVQVKNVDGGAIMGIRGRARRDNMPQVIRQLFDQFYADPPPGIPRGLNIVFYEYYGKQSETAEGIPLICGVQIDAPFSGHGKVVAASTPPGRVAMVTHWGPYSELNRAYTAIDQWGHAQEKPLTSDTIFAGPSWEVYGHHNDNPAKLQTDVYKLLA